MKISFICPFDLAHVTGTPSRARTTILAAQQISENIQVIACGSGDREDPRHIFLGSVGYWEFSKKTTSLLRGSRPDIVHAFTTIALIPAFIYKLLFRWKTKIVFEMHAWSWYETVGRMNIFKRFAFLLFDTVGYVFSDHVIAMSFSQKDYLSRKIFSKKHCTVIWGSVDVPIIFQELAHRDIVVVGYIGNASFWQGVPHIIAAARTLEKEERIHFELAGFDHSRESEFLKLANITYHGRIKMGLEYEFVKSCDVMISPRISGKTSDLQYPHKLSVYMSCGRPVIASNVSDQAQIVQMSGGGIVVDPLSGESLASAIKTFSNLTYGEKNTLAKKACDFAQKHFAFEVFKGRLHDIYNSLFERKNIS